MVAQAVLTNDFLQKNFYSEISFQCITTQWILLLELLSSWTWSFKSWTQGQCFVSAEKFFKTGVRCRVLEQKTLSEEKLEIPMNVSTANNRFNFYGVFLLKRYIALSLICFQLQGGICMRLSKKKKKKRRKCLIQIACPTFMWIWKVKDGCFLKLKGNI